MNLIDIALLLKKLDVITIWIKRNCLNELDVSIFVNLGLLKKNQKYQNLI